MVPSRDLPAMTAQCLCPSLPFLLHRGPSRLLGNLFAFFFLFFDFSSLLSGPPGLSAQAPAPEAQGPALQARPARGPHTGRRKDGSTFSRQKLCSSVPLPPSTLLPPVQRLRGHSPGHSPGPTGPGSLCQPCLLLDLSLGTDRPSCNGRTRTVVFVRKPTKGPSFLPSRAQARTRGAQGQVCFITYPT